MGKVTHFSLLQRSVRSVNVLLLCICLAAWVDAVHHAAVLYVLTNEGKYAAPLSYLY